MCEEKQCDEQMKKNGRQPIYYEYYTKPKNVVIFYNYILADTSMISVSINFDLRILRLYWPMFEVWRSP